MINFLLRQKAIIGLVAILCTIHFLSKDITSHYERPIAGDAQAYYAYLPAIFIYQDLDYDFIDKAAAPHYAPAHLKDFVVDVEGEKVNKTFPGVTVLYTPFFLAGHLSAKILGKPADGYSSIYQLWFDIGIWFYFFFSLVFLRKSLEKLRFSSKTALFTVFLIALGTNVFFYTVYDQSVTHIHNFFMINGLILCLLNFKEKPKTKWLVIAVALLVLIGITRPTNIMVVGLIFFFFPSKDFYKSVFTKIFSKEIWKFVAVSLPILSLPFILWKLQTGNWVVYSYGEEGFDFTHPHFGEFLMSYTKGWFTYTPIALFILVPGLFLLFKFNKNQFGIALGFYLITVYVFSSWWCWYYGAGMSQRVMIDHYILLAYLFALILKYLEVKPALKKWTVLIVGCCVFLNIGQAYQIKNGIIQFGSATKQQYWDNFLAFDQQARVYPKDHWTFIEKISLSEGDPTWGDDEKFHSRFDNSFVSQEQPYSNIVWHYFSKDSVNVTSKFILSFEMQAKSEIENTRAVLILQNRDNFKEEVTFPIYFKEFAKPEKWVDLEFLIEPNGTYTDTLKLFFWNGNSNEKAVFRKVKVSHYQSDEYM